MTESRKMGVMRKIKRCRIKSRRKRRQNYGRRPKRIKRRSRRWRRRRRTRSKRRMRERGGEREVEVVYHKRLINGDYRREIPALITSHIKDSQTIARLPMPPALQQPPGITSLVYRLFLLVFFFLCRFLSSSVVYCLFFPL